MNRNNVRVCCVFVYLLSVFLLSSFAGCRRSEKGNDDLGESMSHVSTGLRKFLRAYPDFLVSVDGNTVVWKDNTRMIFEDGIEDKDFETLLNSPDLQDQLKFIYPIGRKYGIPEKNSDPGRIRYEPFFLKMYGESPEEVKKNLVPISWLPSTVNKTLMVTSINGVNEKLQAVSDELDKLVHLHKYLDNPAGTFFWRPISGTKRLSSHSWGIAIDIDVEYANYWKWDDPKAERFYLGYANKIPPEIVEVFETHGFIWGGKWYHYDTMHFEYRPEVLIED
jgi:peptidoglycan LD-endopeptidase CwlK